ncbi:MAG: UvrD-helicase domain-containing protein [Tannerella sp.]|jgi:ATP-dependent exoDNAse (exonuclease V) beta subunit|nr:UvrD-helicase domain-containing protein [Tannerella sp.]
MLTIYRASAGTGKTHKLTGEYLKLLFSGQDMHARILSVTFTNKATEEMKSRIIKELYQLASGGKSNYLEALIQIKPANESFVRKQARRILIRILHDYAAFNISTIDHFFQQTMRAFVREIGLQGNYRVEMDSDLVLSESIDNLLADLDRAEHKELLKWLLRFSEEKVEKGETWDLRKEIKTLGNELFKEKYKAYSDHINKEIENKEALADYKKILYAMIRSTEAEAKQLGQEALSILSLHHLHPSDFKQGSRSPVFFFERLAGGIMKEPAESFKKLAEGNEACYTKKTPPDKIQAIEQALRNGLSKCIERTVFFFDHLTDYYTAREISRNYYTLGILTDISLQIKAWREDKNRMLIADTTELLNRIIDDSDIPFIYEKTGTRIDHYMIDEFQDTSEMQWRNFRPLVKESLAYRRANLIVGDIKQSIYRFRNSDWTLLDEQVVHDFPPGEIADKTLDENWRSCRNIVEFNNTFFTVAPALLQQIYNQGLETSALTPEQRSMYAGKIISAYAKSIQRVSPLYLCREGHVRIEFLPDEEGKSWKQEAMLRLPSLIAQLQQHGFELRDIAVLVRTRAEGIIAADTLLACKEKHARTDHPFSYDIISEDALMICSSSAVRFMVSMIQYASKPDDSVAGQFAQMAYTVMCRKKHASAGAGQMTADTGFPFTPEMLHVIRQLSCHSFYEMAEGIYRMFKPDVPDNELIFVQAFLDSVADLAEREPVDTDSMLQWWKETGMKGKIATPDSQNAIRILTIHKSKGLGFKAVIIPFGDWDADQKSGSIVWCHPEKAPFDRLKPVPVSYSKELNKTHFANDFYREKLHAYIDNLNALYVAFTRAKEELIVFAPDPEAKQTKTISKLMRESMQTAQINTDREDTAVRPFTDGFQPEQGIFEWGTWQHTSADIQPLAAEIEMDGLPSVLPDKRLHLRLHRKGGFFDDRQRRYGLLMHELLSGIRTVDDIQAAVWTKESGGEISRQESEDMAERLHHILSQPEVKPWFDGSMTVMNEAEILFDDGQSRRPDRIMIDKGRVIIVEYKFGSQKAPAYYSQIKRYRHLIRKMGYNEIEGYIWYVEQHEIERVQA